ncbi:hypothetical protein IPM62_00715 [Candidatus Woesebacteria bacterium]|nr:MAG: hypothetical protein IPM62_00715 [Candidatus Woesebacteria bacterium]
MTERVSKESTTSITHADRAAALVGVLPEDVSKFISEAVKAKPEMIELFGENGPEMHEGGVHTNVIVKATPDGGVSFPNGYTEQPEGQTEWDQAHDPRPIHEKQIRTWAASSRQVGWLKKKTVDIPDSKMVNHQHIGFTELVGTDGQVEDKKPKGEVNGGTYIVIRALHASPTAGAARELEGKRGTGVSASDLWKNMPNTILARYMGVDTVIEARLVENITVYLAPEKMGQYEENLTKQVKPANE